MPKNVPAAATATVSLGTVCATPNLAAQTGVNGPEIWEIVGTTMRATPRPIVPRSRHGGVQPKRSAAVSRAYKHNSPAAPNAANEPNGEILPRDSVPANGYKILVFFRWRGGNLLQGKRCRRTVS